MGGLSTVLVIVSCFRAESAAVACGTPTSPQTTSGEECSGCAVASNIQGVINTVLAAQAAKDEKGCIAAVLGASTQISGYPCVTMKGSGASFTCTLHQTCGTKNATDSTTKTCIYTGPFTVASLSACPADATCAGGGGSTTSTVSSNAKEMPLSLAVAVTAFAVAAIQWRV